METQPETLTWLQFNFPDIEIVVRGYDHLPDVHFDVWTGMMSLPHFHRTTCETVPHRNGYLKIQPDTQEYWQRRVAELSANGRFRVGVAWSGRPTHRADRRRSVNFELLSKFLDATDAVLVRRFEQVRRPHPLQGDGTLLDGIVAERARMAGLREQSDLVIDTSDLNIHQLAMRAAELFGEESAPSLKLTVLSFGFKYGLPADADMVADLRFLPNPYWVPELSPLTGQDEAVRDFVLSQPDAPEFLEHYVAALAAVADGYRRENKRHATIAMGCTGGKHRSVAMAEEVARQLRSLPGVSVTVRHRDLGRE